MTHAMEVTRALESLVAKHGIPNQFPWQVVSALCPSRINQEAMRDVVRSWRGRIVVQDAFVRFRHGWFIATGARPSAEVRN